ncbi:MAG TPA: hypothetical protein VGE59_02925, partial [Patescibacteria group bacterium]
WNRTYYENNRLLERGRILERKKSIAEKLAFLKSSKSCCVCGESSSVCLDFHHLDDKTKSFNLSDVKSWGWSMKKVEAEIEKCVVLCANCHRKVHAGIIDITNHSGIV